MTDVYTNPDGTTRPFTPLCHLARKYGTDKGGNHLIAGETCHQYTETYWKLLAPYREQVQSVLEIGVNNGVSLRMWREFFVNARIVGLDIEPSCCFTDERIQCFVADQGHGESLEGALTLAGIPKYDLIVDDGSHDEHHQVFSANVLSSRLAPNGVYVIEDIHVSCRPERYLSAIKGYEAYAALPTGVGLGKARCGCGTGCGQGERLLVLAHNPDRIFP